MADAESAHQTKILSYLWRREIKKRTSIAFLLLLLAFVKQRYVPALSIGALVIFSELLVYRATLQIDRSTRGISFGAVYQCVAVCVFANLIYGAISILLITIPSFAIAVVGLMWCLGALVYVATNYSSLPLYFWANFVPQVVATIAAMVCLSQHPANNSIAYEWLVATSICSLYIHTAVQVLHRQQATQQELDTARREAEERSVRLEYISQHDPMTGLLSRSAFDQRLAQLLEDENERSGLVVLLVDLDRFKPINDSYGHEAGDKVLKVVSDRIGTFVGDDGLAARLGGDEFAVLRRDIFDSSTAVALGVDLVESIGKPIDFRAESLSVGASIGIAFATQVENEVAALCGSADRAMFSAKESATTSVALFDPAITPQRPSIQDHNELVQAIERREIHPFYQPQVDMRTGEIVGFEALARWRHPDKGLLMPSDFLPAIEQLGLQVEFTRSMTRQVLESIESMLDADFNIRSVSVNVAEEVLAVETGRRQLFDLIRLHPAASRYLTIEVTENVVTSRCGDAVTEAISDLANQGQRISLDDFGTGFASFQHLRQLTFHELKIDDSLVRSIGDADTTSEMIVDSFISIAAGLAVETVAEGVETEQQREFLVERQCVIGQGLLFSEAISIEQALRLLEEQRSTEVPTPSV